MQFLTQEKGVELAGVNPDYATQDLFDTIESGKPVKWDVFIVRSLSPFACSPRSFLIL